ncbi:hypothetical protein ABZO31_14735 [Streptomyces sp. HUAS MG47]
MPVPASPLRTAAGGSLALLATEAQADQAKTTLSQGWGKALSG